MKNRASVIQFGGLNVGSHIFELDIDDKFFEGLDYSEVTKANVKAEIELVKQNSVLTLNFHLTGTVDTVCDRCALEVGLPIDIEQSIVVKHGNPEDSTDEIVVLPHGEAEVDVAHFLYEFITLAIPVKRVPCEEDEDIECDYEALDKLDAVGTDEERQDSSEEVNPIWEKLKKIKISEN